MEENHNGNINRGRADSRFTACGIFLRWISTAQKEEVSFTNREVQLKTLSTVPKVKDNPKDKTIIPSF